MAGQPQRLEFLDSIRGLAALAVLFGHSLIFEWPPIVRRVLDLPLVNIPFNGREAVAMFFVLSGYILSRPYFALPETHRPARKLFIPAFYLRRFTRIWLPWAFVFCLSALAQASIFREWATTPPQTEWGRSFWHVPLSFENAVRQGLFILHDPQVQLIPQDWSLGVELKASILLPLLIFLCLRGAAWSLLVIAAPWVIFGSMGASYCGFIFGVLLARYSDRLVTALTSRPLSVKVTLLALGLVGYEAFHFGTSWLGQWNAGNYYLVITSLGCVLILIASLSSRRLQAALHLPPLLFLGRVSYSVYLLQFIVILCVVPPWIALLNSWGVHRSLWLLPLSLLVSIGLTLALSALNYRWVEKPCIDLGHRLSRKIHEKFADKPSA